MPLDPILAPLVEQLRGDLPDIPIEQERADGLASSRQQFGSVVEPPPDSVKATVLWLPGPDGAPPVMVKVHRTESDRPRPGLLFIHGGGWSTGGADWPESDAECGWLAHEADLVVISVEYRLAPEHPYPAGLLDCYAALQQVVANADLLGLDPTRLAIGGGSAGGNLSAAVALKARDEAGPALQLQLLEAPALDLTLGSASVHQWDAEFPAVAQLAATLGPRYLTSPEQAHDPYVSPLLADDLSSLPPAVILACEIDPVRDDAIRYAERLQAAGVPATCQVFEGLLHGTWSLTLLLPQARAWRQACVDALRTL
ncbi:MAG: alpha/beta hydrolase [Propionibacteriaceae bacterium]|jgi:acetyl esterase|nr:alpha/beta hydrolase [Propionibacteriaceae bacterium]